ncbi:MAG: hypothetical protein Q9172_001250 [Xanthocarpia lactea]
MAHIARNVTESVLLDGPALQPPPGVVANVTNRSDEQFWYYILYAPIIFLVKAAILLQYLRLFAPSKTVNPSMFIGARVIIVVTGVYYIISTSITIWACSPREKIWNPLITEGHCLNDDIAVLFTCLFNIASDVAILVLPARFCNSACLANVFIIIYTVRMGAEDADFTYNAAWQGFWAYAEISLGIIVTCTLTLPKFIEARGKKLRAMALTISKPFGTLAHSTRSRLVKTETTVPSDSTATGSLEWRRDEDQSLETHSIEARPKTERWSTVPIYNQTRDRIELV